MKTAIFTKGDSNSPDSTEKEDTFDQLGNNNQKDLEDGTKTFISKLDPSKLAKPTKLPQPLGVALFVTAIFSYLLSDRKCPYKRDSLCLVKFILPNIPYWSGELLISATCFSILLIGSVTSPKISKLFLPLSVVAIIYLGYFYDPVLTKQEYGQMVSLIFQLILLLELFAYSLYAGFRFCYRKTKKIVPAALIPLLILAIWFWISASSSCAHWTEGLGQRSLKNEPDTCQINPPSLCVYEMTSNVFDLSLIYTSSSSIPSEKIMNEYYPQTPYVGFPRTEKFTDDQRYVDNMQKSFLQGLVPLNTISENRANDFEIILNKTVLKESDLIITVRRNETLVSERVAIPSTPMFKNLIVIYIDALSRRNAIRKLPETMAWFDKFAKGDNDDRETFQFFKYHSLAGYTTPNLWAAFFGTEETEGPAPDGKKIPSIIKTFKDNGFITAHASDFCQDTSLEISPDSKIGDVPYDHEGFSFSCDPNYDDLTDPFGIFRGPYSSFRRGLYGKDIFKYSLDYGRKFWDSYPEEKKLLYLEFLDAHEGTGEVIKYVDKDLAKFLSKLENDKMLDDTGILLYADHGLHMNGIFTLMDFYQVGLEKFLPVGLLVVPKRVAEKHRDNLLENEQNFFTAYNINKLFKTIAEGESSSSMDGSPFSQIPKTTCDEVGIKQGQCYCNFHKKP